MRVLIACDKYKGTLSALEVGRAIERGLGPGFTSEICPIADGGEGFVDSMLAALGGERVRCASRDALGRAIDVSYGICGNLAVIEMAEASGLWRIEKGEQNIREASTYGTGMMLADAAERGVAKILIGIGGSATNDAGLGMAAALGWKFFNRAGELVSDPTPNRLIDLAEMDSTGVGKLPAIEVACDVTNPLLGSKGATAIFGPQKGAQGEDFEFLEAYLARVIEVAGKSELADFPGAGAAGGLGWGLMSFCGASLRGGFEMVADALQLEEKVRNCDVVITGEGSLDLQSLDGKGPVGIARMAKELGKPVYVMAGQIAPEIWEAGIFEGGRGLTDLELPLEVLFERSAELVEQESRVLGGMLIG